MKDEQTMNTNISNEMRDIADFLTKLEGLRTARMSDGKRAKVEICLERANFWLSEAAKRAGLTGKRSGSRVKA